MMRVLMIGMGVVAAAIVVGAICLDEGEVAVLQTKDASGAVHETQLWSVELEGVHYLRAATPGVDWLARLKERRQVAIEFGENEEEDGDSESELEASSVTFYAVPEGDAALRVRLNAAMAQKYGLADRLWGAVGDRSQSIPIRLDPIPEEHFSTREDAS